MQITSEAQSRAMTKILLKTTHCRIEFCEVYPLDLKEDPVAKVLIENRIKRGLGRWDIPRRKDIPIGTRPLDGRAIKKGTRGTWVPVKARKNCYGHPIGTMPLVVIIQSGPSRTGHYLVDVEHPADRRLLSQSHGLKVLGKHLYVAGELLEEK